MKKLLITKLDTDHHRVGQIEVPLGTNVREAINAAWGVSQLTQTYPQSFQGGGFIFNFTVLQSVQFT